MRTLLLLVALPLNGCMAWSVIQENPHPQAECFGRDRTGYSGATMAKALRKCERAKDAPCTPLWAPWDNAVK